MEEGMKSSRIINGREIERYAKNGLKFKGYIDGETGEITNFFLTLKYKCQVNHVNFWSFKNVVFLFFFEIHMIL